MKYLALLSLLVTLLWPTDGLAVSRVNFKTGFDNANATPTLDLTGSFSADNWIGTAIRWSSSVTLNSITDSCGNTYTIKGNNPITGSAGSLWAAHAVAKVTSAGDCVITYNFSSAPSGTIYYGAVEVSGADSTDAVGSQHAAQLSELAGTGTDAVTSGTMGSNPPASSYIWGWSFNISLITLSVGTGFSSIESTNAWTFEEVTSGTNNACTFTSGSSDYFTVGCIAFKPASAAASPSFRRRIQ